MDSEKECQDMTVSCINQLLLQETQKSRKDLSLIGISDQKSLYNKYNMLKKKSVNEISTSSIQTNLHRRIMSGSIWTNGKNFFILIGQSK